MRDFFFEKPPPRRCVTICVKTRKAWIWTLRYTQISTHLLSRNRPQNWEHPRIFLLRCWTTQFLRWFVHHCGACCIRLRFQISVASLRKHFVVLNSLCRLVSWSVLFTHTMNYLRAQTRLASTTAKVRLICHSGAAVWPFSRMPPDVAFIHNANSDTTWPACRPPPWV